MRQPSVCSGVAVERVPDDRMPEMCGVHAYLVHASGFDGELHKRKPSVPGQCVPVRNGALPSVFNHCHALGVPALASDWRVQRVLARRWCAMQHGKVGLADFGMRLEHLAQAAVCADGFGRHHHAARLPVETVDYARALDAADAGHRRAMGEQGVHERTAHVTRRGMRYHAGRLGHDDDVGVLEKDVERNALRAWRVCAGASASLVSVHASQTIAFPRRKRKPYVFLGALTFSVPQGCRFWYNISPMEIVYTVLAIVACILLFSFAIFIHEFGHFLAARKLGLRVDVFSIGFGPAIWKRKIGDVEYRISWIPFGGYVALPDLDPEGTKALEGQSGKGKGKSGEDGGDAPAASKPEPASPLPEIAPWKKIVVAFMGPFGNIVLAVALALLLAAIPGVRFGEMPTEIGEVLPDGPAAKAGMQPGDKVLSVNGNAVETWTELKTEMQIAGGDAPVPFVVDRSGSNVTLSVALERDKASGLWYMLAASTSNELAKAAAWMPARNPLKQLAWDAMSIWRVLKALVTPKETKAVARALGGPVMIAEGLYNQVRRNVWDALGFLRFLCINLAILNLLPIPVLDGGLILFALYELVMRRKVPRRLVDGLSKVFMYVFLGLMLLLVYRDVTRSVRIHRAVDEMEKAAATNTVEKAEK